MNKQIFIIEMEETNKLSNSERLVCNICMDEMKGNVTLKCGHEMCPLCFSKHARIHNLCPFCRDEFAPAINNTRTSRMPRDVAEFMVQNTVQEYYYDSVFHNIVEITEPLDIELLKTSIYGFMYQISMNVIHDIEQWYTYNDQP